MCGHCTERAALAERLLSLETRASTVPDPLLSTLHLQEARDWRQPAWLASAEHDPMTAIVVMCRAWTDSIAGLPCPPLQDMLPTSLYARLAAWRGTLDLPAAWSWLRDDATEMPEPVPLQDARDELDAYLAGWLQLPAPAGPPWNDTTLHEHLPRVSVALDLLAREEPDETRLAALATTSPGVASPFSAVDLWLQRRALRALVAHHGIGFVIGRLGQLRSGAILALVLQGDLDDQELHALHAALQAHPDLGTEGERDLRTALVVLIGEGAGRPGPERLDPHPAFAAVRI